MDELLPTIDSALPTAEAIDAESIDRQGFCIGQLQLLIQFTDSSELLELPPLIRIPSAPRSVRGVINLHGNVVPVFAIHDYLSQAKTEHKQMLLVVGRGEATAGVLIDGLPVRKRFIADDQLDATQSPEVLQPFFMSAYQSEGSVWTQVDMPQLLHSSM
jgi:twitching motility protein PilI